MLVGLQSGILSKDDTSQLHLYHKPKKMKKKKKSRGLSSQDVYKKTAQTKITTRTKII
jgi:hypothetical protein